MCIVWCVVEIRLWRGVTVYITRMEDEANVLIKLILTNCQGQVYCILGLLLFSASVYYILIYFFDPLKIKWENALFEKRKKRRIIHFSSPSQYSYSEKQKYSLKIEAIHKLLSTSNKINHFIYLRMTSCNFTWKLQSLTSSAVVNSFLTIV